MGPMTSERVLKALAKKPELLWAVAQNIRILGPWVVWPVDGGVALRRQDPWGRPATLRSTTTTRDGQTIWELKYADVSFTLSSDESGFEAVVEHADRLLREEGIVLM